MTHLRKRAPGNAEVTWVSIGVRGERAARIVANARNYAQVRGVTFGSLVMEALAKYMAQAVMQDARALPPRLEGE